MRKEGKSMTNEEKIKSMTTEELAGILVWMTKSHTQNGEDYTWHSPSGYLSWFKAEAVADCVKWLKSEEKA